MALLSRDFNRKTSVCLLETQHWTRPSILFHFRSFLFLAVVFRLLSQWKSCGTSRSRQARGVAIYMANMTVVHRASRSIAQRQARHRRHRTGPGPLCLSRTGANRTGWRRCSGRWSRRTTRDAAEHRQRPRRDGDDKARRLI